MYNSIIVIRSRKESYRDYMSRLLKILKEKKFSLIASIPENDYELAKIAWEAGVDAIKVHINVFHRASQNSFGSLESQKELFKKIIEDSPVPVGIVAGEDADLVESILDEIVELGFDFISLHGVYTPASLVKRNDIANFYAVDYTYSIQEIDAVSNSFVADILELSICDPSTYGTRLNARDLARYERIASKSKIPTVVPTQRVVKPSDVSLLYKCGISAVMVGAISMGKTKESISQTLKEFKKAIDEL